MAGPSFVIDCSSFTASATRLRFPQLSRRAPHPLPSPASSKRCRAPAVASVSPAATAPAVGAGSIKVIPEGDVSVGDVIYIEYKPPAGMFDLENDDEMISFAGGFKGWTGAEDDETLIFPCTKLLDGALRVSVCVPDYATSIQFGFFNQSGFAFDMTYAITVKFRKRPKKGSEEGEVEMYVAGEEAEVDEAQFGADLKRESASAPVLTVDAEETLHQIRGEATMVGEEAGVGSVFISQVRDTFSRFDVEGVGLIQVEDIPRVLGALSFELDDDRLKELTKKYVARGDQCAMTEFMGLYCELENEDEGIVIV